jgi:hypothetical protein
MDSWRERKRHPVSTSRSLQRSNDSRIVDVTKYQVTYCELNMFIQKQGCEQLVGLPWGCGKEL